MIKYVRHSRVIRSPQGLLYASIEPIAPPDKDGEAGLQKVVDGERSHQTIELPEGEEEIQQSHMGCWNGRDERLTQGVFDLNSSLQYFWQNSIGYQCALHGLVSTVFGKSPACSCAIIVHPSVVDGMHRIMYGLSFIVTARRDNG